MMMTNDDMLYETPGWGTIAVEALREQKFNGIVAFYDSWMPGFPTFCVMHAANHVSVMDGVIFPFQLRGAHQDPTTFDIFAGVGLAQIRGDMRVRNRVGNRHARFNYDKNFKPEELILRWRRDISRILGVPLLADIPVMATWEHARFLRARGVD